jgi:hypothetical protein
LAIQPILAILLSSAVAALLGAAACRKIASPHLPLLSKRHAVLLGLLACSAIILPLGAHSTSATDSFALLVFTIPACALCAMLATPTFEAWAMALRRGRRLRWWDDDAAPSFAMGIMLVGLVGLLACGVHGFPSGLSDAQRLALAWTGSVALSLPIFMLFASTRYATAAARWGFAAAVGAHLIVQMTGIGLTCESSSSELHHWYLQSSAVEGILVPVLILWRQRVLRRRVVAGA